MTISGNAYPDVTAFDSKNCHYDPKSTKAKPIWYMVNVTLEHEYENIISLKELQQYKDKELMGMDLFRQTRLSVGKVPKECFEFIESKLVKGGVKKKQEVVKSKYF